MGLIDTGSGRADMKRIAQFDWLRAYMCVACTLTQKSVVGPCSEGSLSARRTYDVINKELHMFSCVCDGAGDLTVALWRFASLRLAPVSIRMCPLGFPPKHLTCTLVT